ncbi:hypothetical protein FO519_001177 [Halicephalobus sp. NKZ332]|nr:hypothetical protein FO519_001177 [Halicephalobus sp. NKZ332]
MDPEQEYEFDNNFENNPGSFLDLHLKARRVHPRLFNGLMLGVGVGQRSYFEILRRHIRQDNVLAFGACIDYQFFPTAKFRFIGNPKESEDNPDELHLGFEGRSPISTFGVELADKLKFHFLQKHDERIDFGIQISKSINNIDGPFHFDVAGRYIDPRFTLSTVIGTSGMHNSLFFQIDQLLSLGIEQKFFTASGNFASIALKKQIPEWEADVSLSIDSQKSLVMNFERIVAPTVPLRLLLSASMNGSTKTITAGLGLLIN